MEKLIKEFERQIDEMHENGNMDFLAKCATENFIIALENSMNQSELESVKQHEQKEKKCTCGISSWNRDAGCFVCDECGEKI